jgi:putative membrane protein
MKVENALMPLLTGIVNELGKDMTMMGFGFGIFGLLFMLLFWGGLIALAVWLVRLLFPGQAQSQPPTSGPELSIREILDRRYARGEITREQYELTKQDLD